METAATRKPEITWKTVTRKVGELEEWDQNPRVITELAFNQLVESILEDGYHNRIKITQDNLIIGGHQRKRALLAAGLTEETQIEVLQACHPLTPEQFGRVNIRDNLPHYGDFDWNKLPNLYEPMKLIEWHMPEKWLKSSIAIEGDDANSEDVKEIKKPSKSKQRDGYRIIVECNSQNELEAIYEKLCDEGYECRLA